VSKLNKAPNTQDGTASESSVVVSQGIKHPLPPLNSTPNFQKTKTEIFMYPWQLAQFVL
jgi:hypothetical protein